MEKENFNAEKVSKCKQLLRKYTPKIFQILIEIAIILIGIEIFA